MNPVEIIVKKRDGLELSQEEIRFFVDGFVSGEIPDYQVAAWAMAVFFQGMSALETGFLTLAMAASGAQLDLHDAVAPGTLIVDKHSSGGVGDKTTLAVGPIVAACGLPVGKMSGRGLSFTGGTIDKLESIAGWSPDLTEEQFRRQLGEIGLVIAGQTVDLAPADKALYALRDVTGTVPSLPLIASSIMSKKLAAGADAIVLDVKCGAGAFMQTLEDARRLARLMTQIGAQSDRQVTALITQMEQPLGYAVGNALEVVEAIDVLNGRGPDDFRRLVEAVATEMLVLGQPAAARPSRKQAVEQVRAAIKTGTALTKLREFVVAQGGDGVMVDEPSRLPQAPVTRPLIAGRSGSIKRILPRAVGLTVVNLGGGRRKKGDIIDHRVGVCLSVKVGNVVERGDELCIIHAATEDAAAEARMQLAHCFEIVDEAVTPYPVVYDSIATDPENNQPMAEEQP